MTVYGLGSKHTVIHCQTHTLGVGGVSSAVSSPSCCKTNTGSEIGECAISHHREKAYKMSTTLTIT